jgi:hypothetical protein
MSLLRQLYGAKLVELSKGATYTKFNGEVFTAPYHGIYTDDSCVDVPITTSTYTVTMPEGVVVDFSALPSPATALDEYLARYNESLRDMAEETMASYYRQASNRILFRNGTSFEFENHNQGEHQDE